MGRHLARSWLWNWPCTALQQEDTKTRHNTTRAVWMNIVHTGSRKGHDNTAYWGFILKQAGNVRASQKGRVEKKKNKEGHNNNKPSKNLGRKWVWECQRQNRSPSSPLEEKAELRLSMDLKVVHQKAYTKEGAYWQENDEVDHFVRMMQAERQSRESMRRKDSCLTTKKRWNGEKWRMLVWSAWCRLP